MKTRLYILLALIAVVFGACNLDSESNYTPYLTVGPFILDGDTLKYQSTADGAVLDTITVGDTVFVSVYTNSYRNNLLKLSITEQGEYTEILYPPVDSLLIYPDRTSKESIFHSTSDYTKGKFIFDGELSELLFSFKYVAKKAGKTVLLKVAVASDAKLDYNTTGIELRTPIKEKKEEKIE